MASRKNSAAIVVIVFLLCAVGDFIWGYVHQRSVFGALVCAILGLFGTAFYMAIIWSSRDKDEPRDSSRE
jgi:hypothetical protein